MNPNDPATNKPLNPDPLQAGNPFPSNLGQPSPITGSSPEIGQVFQSPEIIQQPSTAPQSFPNNAFVVPSDTPPKEPKKPNKNVMKVVAVIIALILFLMIASVAAAYSVAYGKVGIGNPELQKKIEFFVMELPMTPKSARYLFYKSMMSDAALTSQAFDLSASIKSNSTSPDLLGLSNFDIAAKGDIDIKDQKNLMANMNISITKEFNVDIKTKDKQVYFKINKLPNALLSVLGLNSELLSPLTNTWVTYDATPLNSEARKLLDETSEDTPTPTDMQKELEKYIDDTLLQSFKVSEGDDNGVAVYKIHGTPSPEAIDKVAEKIEKEANPDSGFYINPNGKPIQKTSDILKNMAIDIWMDKKTYNTRRVAISFRIIPDSSLSQSLSENNVLGVTDSLIPGLGSSMDVAFVMAFSEYGKTVVVDVPTDALSFEEYTARFSTIMRELYSIQMPSLQE